MVPRNAPYLVVYPFVKHRPWYFLTFEERAEAMREHAEVGGKFVTVTNHTTYSFGIDDQEFMPAFEIEEPADFMHLMMTLRETEASRWTERDTPSSSASSWTSARRSTRSTARSPSSRAPRRSTPRRTARGTRRPRGSVSVFFFFFFFFFFFQSPASESGARIRSTSR